MSTDETDMEVVMSVSGTAKAFVLFSKATGVEPSSFLIKDSIGQASVTTALTTTVELLAPTPR